MKRCLCAIGAALAAATPSLAEDWYIGVNDPDEVIHLTQDRTVDGDVIIVNSGELHLSEGAWLTVTGRVVLADEAHLQIDAASLRFPQTYSYESEIIAAGASLLRFTDATIDCNGFSYSLGLTGTARAELTRTEVENGFATWAFFEDAGATISDCVNTGEFVLFGEGDIEVSGSNTVLVWVTLFENSSIDTTFPEPGAVDSFEIGPDTPWATGIPYTFTLSDCTEVWWAVMARSGSSATVRDSTLRVVGSYFERDNVIEVAGVANSAAYADQAHNWGDIDYHFLNTTIQTWNFYAAGSTDLTLTQCVIGELLVTETGRGTLMQTLCDGSGGYLGVEGNGEMLLFLSTNTSQFRVRGDGRAFVAHSSLLGGPIVAQEQAQVFFINALHAGPLHVDDAAFLMEGAIESVQATVGNEVELRGTSRLHLGPEALLTYQGYELHYALEDEPDAWHAIGQPQDDEVVNGVLGTWETLGLDAGDYQVRLSVLNNFGEPLEVLASALLSPPIFAGDLNGDGVVDQADLGILLSCYDVSDCGDIDGDGDTDQSDLGMLLANFGYGG